MKNKYRLLTLAILLLTFFGCQTEDIKPETETETIIENAEVETNSASYDFKVEVKNDMLSFATRNDYDIAIEYLAQIGDENFESWEKDLDFTSMASAYNIEQLVKRGISDPLLATLLNPSGMIEIAGNVFTLDMMTEKVTVISSAEFGNNPSTAKGRREFSTEDDILDILDGTVTLESSETARKYCKSYRKTGSVSAGGSRTTYIMEYRRAGILNTLGVIAFQKYNLSVIMKTTGISFYRNKKRCITENSRLSTGRGNYEIVRIYNSSRRLKAYNLDVNFTAIPFKKPIGAKRDVIRCGSQVPCS